MATVHPRSRYTRPLKATHSFIKGTPASTNGQKRQSPVGGGVAGHTFCSSLPTSPSSSSVSGGQRYGGSLKRKAHSSHTHSTESNPRRSSSLGSLCDDSYWTMPTSLQDNETEDGSEFSHKRSNSLSAADHLQQQNGGRRVHTCTSVEGLNQEVSQVLEGQPSMMSHHPDGHIAPVQDLLQQLSIGGTPPHPHITPSPHSTPLTASHHHNSEDSVEARTGNQSLAHARDSPATPDYGHYHPLSPKPSFAREPPVGAERCIIRHNTRLFPGDFIQKGPDRSKVNIIFKGTVFAPTSPTLPVGGIKC